MVLLKGLDENHMARGNIMRVTEGARPGATRGKSHFARHLFFRRKWARSSRRTSVLPGTSI